jgi:uncharacterized repeat protein (TIGR01451 family)
MQNEGLTGNSHRSQASRSPFERRGGLRDHVIAGALLITLGLAVQTQAEAGRLLVKQPAASTALVECNDDGSGCFTVVNNGAGNLNSSVSSGSIANDGTIAFEAAFSVDGTCAPGGQGICRSHVFRMDPDGTNVRQLTFNPDGPCQSSPGGSFFGGDNSAAISPDGTMVAFVSNRNPAYDTSTNPPTLSCLGQVYVVNADGTNLRQLTFPQFNGTSPFGQMYSIAWSPDSAKLAFRADQFGTFCGTFFGSPEEFEAVGVVNADGTGFGYLTCVRTGSGAGQSLDWSPDGTLIAFGRDPSLGPPAIAFLDLSGQGRYATGLTLAQLGSISACTTGFPQCIHFSPDSAKLAYVNGGNTISTINLDGTGRVDTGIPFGGGFSGGSGEGLWWTSGTVPAAAQLTLAPDPVEVWPGYSQQLTPSLLDAGNNVILHTAASYEVFRSANPSCRVEIGPYGLVMFSSGNGNDSNSIRAENAGLTAQVSYKCWASAPCTYTLSSGGETFCAVGGSGSVGVTADPGANDSTCPWSATSNVPWIRITSGSGGRGNGQVSFTVAPNTGAARQGTMTIGGQTFTVTQNDAATSSADLAISKTDSPDPVTTGSDLTYTITVTNNGPCAATGVTMTDPLPATMTYVSATSSQGTCSGTSTVTCNLGALANGASATGTIVVTPTQSGVIGNTASVTSNESDPNPDNNSATQATTVNAPPSADLSITKTDSPDPVPVGANITYTITATNGGPDTATGVTVTDTLPGGVTLVSATASQGSCNGSATVTCSLGSLANGSSAAVTIVVTATQAGTISNTASVSANESDPDPSNNSATQETTVNAGRQLTALSPAKLWLAESGPQSRLRLDLLAEVFVNGAKVGAGQRNNVAVSGSDFTKAKLETVSLALGSATDVPAGATLAIQVSVRSSCSVTRAGNVGVARLWYNGQLIDKGNASSRDAGSRFDATIGGTNSNYFLRSAFTLATAAGTAREFIDVAVSDGTACPTRPFTPFGTWSIAIP